MERLEILIPARPQPTRLTIGSGLAEIIIKELKERYPGCRFALISDRRVAARWSAPLREALGAGLYTFPSGERSKSRRQKEKLEDRLLRDDFGRDTVVLALGGSSSRFEQARFDTNGAALSGSMDCGEGVDSAGLRLPDGQHELFARVRAAAKKLVTVLIIGRPYAVPEIAEGSDGLLVAFYPGPWGGQALAEILLGRFSPSGRLPVSFPRHPGQLPVYYNPKAGIVPWSYADSKQGPLFSFGDGLGYGRIQYRDFELLPKPLPEGTLSEGTLPVDDTPVLELHFRAENPGPAEETAVPMLFVTDLESDVTRRVRELKAFDKKAVPAGESAAFSLTLTAEGLAVWNRRMERELQRGRFRLCLQDGGRSLYETIWTL